MKIRMMPTISIDELVDALNIQYNLELDRDDLLEIMFPDLYANDCYKLYYFGDFLEGDEYQQENCIIAYLKDIFPDLERILIYISW